MNVVAGARATREARGKLPEVRARRRMTAGHWRFELAVPAELAWFAGHFPGHPVLPGVAQVGWAIRFAREAFGFAADPPRIERVKFQHPIEPGSGLFLELSRGNENPARIEWRFGHEETTLSRGSLDFTTAP